MVEADFLGKLWLAYMHVHMEPGLVELMSLHGNALMHVSPPISGQLDVSHRWLTICSAPSQQTGYTMFSVYAFSQVVIAQEFVQLLESQAAAAHPVPTATAGPASASAHPDAKPVSQPDEAAEGMQSCSSNGTLPARSSSETGTEGSEENEQERQLQDLQNGVQGVKLSDRHGVDSEAAQAASQDQHSCTHGVRSGRGGWAGLLHRYPNVSA